MTIIVFSSGPNAEDNHLFLTKATIEQVDSTVAGVDEWGNSKLRTMILKQWADPNAPLLCGMDKKAMFLTKEYYLDNGKHEVYEYVKNPSTKYYIENSYRVTHASDTIIRFTKVE